MPTTAKTQTTETSPRRPTPVSEVMTRHPISIDGAATVRELASLLLENEISGVPVIDEQERVIGVVSRTDLVLRLVEGQDGSVPQTFLESIAGGLAYRSDLEPDEFGVVSEFMNPEPITVAPEESVADVARLMAEERVHRVIVVDDRDRLLGIVTTLDLLAVFPQ